MGSKQHSDLLAVCPQPYVLRDRRSILAPRTLVNARFPEGSRPRPYDQGPNPEQGVNARGAQMDLKESST